MPEISRQKFAYGSEVSSCVNIAAAPDGTIRLRESDDPDIVLTASPAQFGTLIDAVKNGHTRG
ncbi:DUF397 domain-containing protein [Streptomyces sp. RLB3-17]|jgi:hypothetical protein|uniref:DUF397 domain-containing protein n=1 Tax=Streptomyces TaxID=1883 RepID=UPI000765E3B5|nr:MULTISPECIES: DUF397 domain-containing protein [Streptomyces]KAF5995250.1 DUF397 domain-containing protein [Streptomyces sp. WAC00263]MCZ1001684.1 DUF397 domain-containing protein [Streptomyces mirabilis]NMI60494.1 DUF397 domain-containing protein [Streptomyces sp. RLA2-12]QDN59651.1 DUF397 domain-containing protein [Streptomyces sp. S1D4-20]QDN69728.1 DUF397 domain-containing protein [Streptomyces sp. S1D4-14]